MAKGDDVQGPGNRDGDGQGRQCPGTSKAKVTESFAAERLSRFGTTSRGKVIGVIASRPTHRLLMAGARVRGRLTWLLSSAVSPSSAATRRHGQPHAHVLLSDHGTSSAELGGAVMQTCAWQHTGSMPSFSPDQVIPLLPGAGNYFYLSPRSLGCVCSHASLSAPPPSHGQTPGTVLFVARRHQRRDQVPVLFRHALLRSLPSRSSHTALNRLIVSRLPLCLPPFTDAPTLYTVGLLHFAHVYLTFESLWADLAPPTAKPTPSSPLLSFLLVDPWDSEHTPDKQIGATTHRRMTWWNSSWRCDQKDLRVLRV